MGSRHHRTLLAVFEEPTRANIAWEDIERMLIHFGATTEERAGSRVAFSLNGRRAVLHRPHPAKEAKQSLVRSVRDFCAECGLTPDGGDE